MAHFAKLDENNIVIEVLVVDNKMLLDSNGVEQEALGVAFLSSLTDWSSWKQTSYNTNGGVRSDGGTPFRKNYAGIGYTYDEDKDAFYEPQTFPSWTLNEESCLWQPPIPYPNNGTPYYWDEDEYQADNSTGWLNTSE
tara:strand:+ start:867 stop:1280 length:414 start_codon:yes stop_codon:yes gene_type:complete